jgi:surfactin synthase thioesterase subunit
MAGLRRGRVNWGRARPASRVDHGRVRVTDWFIPLSDADRAVAHVYAFPQAGGGATAFAALADAVGPDIAVWALNLPGRQARFAEDPRTDLGPLLDELAAAVPDRAPGFLFGYCSGALLAFLLARRMREVGRRLPAELVVASYPAPDRAEPARTTHLLPVEEFWAEILSYGGVPEGVAAQPDFREIFEPALRADYALLAGYGYADGPPLPMPITAVSGAEDPVLLADDVDRWRAHTTAAFEAVTVPGDHWLLEGALPHVRDLLRARCAQTVA